MATDYDTFFFKTRWLDYFVLDLQPPKQGDPRKVLDAVLEHVDVLLGASRLRELGLEVAGRRHLLELLFKP